MAHNDQRNRKLSALAAAAALPLAGGAVSAQAQSSGPEQAATPMEALVDADVDLNFRYRFENVDQEGFEEEANASTLKSRLTYNSGTWQGASLTMEFDHVTGDELGRVDLDRLAVATDGRRG